MEQIKKSNKINCILKKNVKKNVDRCSLELSHIDINDDSFSFNFNSYYACYHLENGIKTGAFGFEKIIYDYKIDDNNQIEVNIKSCVNNSNLGDNSIDDFKYKELSYGILDFKKDDYYYTANSNGTIGIFKENLEMKNEILIDNLNENLVNCLEIYKDKNNKAVLYGMNNGQIGLLDLEKLEVKYHKKCHEYGVWALKQIDENLFLSGADDNLIVLNDIRISKICGEYKEHSAGITHLNFLFDSKFDILTGSYDESISIFDLRFFNKSKHRKKIDVSIWDIKQIKKTLKENNNEQYSIIMTSIYDGVNLYEINNPFGGDNFKITPIYKFEEHQKIVYGIDIYEPDKCNLLKETNIDTRIREKLNKDVIISTCSLYDNLICYWNYSLMS